MNLKLKAAGITVGLIASAFVAAELIRTALSYVTAEQIADAIGWVCIAGLVYMFYQLVLARLEHDKTLKDLNKSIKAEKVDQ